MHSALTEQRFRIRDQVRRNIADYVESSSSRDFEDYSSDEDEDSSQVIAHGARPAPRLSILPAKQPYSCAEVLAQLKELEAELKSDVTALDEETQALKDKLLRSGFFTTIQLSAD